MGSKARKRKLGKLQGNRSGFPEWLQQYANMGLNENGEITSDAIGRGAGFSNTQLAEMQFNHDEADRERQYNEEMYLKYQSPEAQMRQYQDAGLNPALMYEGGVDINGPSSAGAASTSGAVGGDSPTNGFEQVMGIMSQFMSMITGASGIGNSVIKLVQLVRTMRLKMLKPNKLRLRPITLFLRVNCKKLNLSTSANFMILMLRNRKSVLKTLKNRVKRFYLILTLIIVLLNLMALKLTLLGV